MPGILVDEPSPQLREFLRDFVSSYEELEVLLLLAREAREWSVPELAEALRAPADVVEAAAKSLVQVGGVVATVTSGTKPRFVFTPKDERRRGLVTELARAYLERRLTIVQIMSANAVARVRGAAIRRFADSFRLERPKK